MKNSKIILGGATLMAVAGVFTVASIGNESNNEETSYTSRTEILQTNDRLAEAQKEDYERLRVDMNTGEYDPEVWKQSYEAAKKFMKANAGNRVVNMSWDEKGPDNVGGRTRALAIDPQNENHVFVGSVSGGLFESFDGGNNWTKVASFPEVAIGSIGISNVAPYRILVGTGNSWDPVGVANGVWESSDNGASWSQISGTSSWAYTNDICPLTGQDNFLLASSIGLRQYDGSSISNFNSAPTLSNCNMLDVSNDNQNIVAVFGTSRRISNDGGANWTTLTAADISISSRTEFRFSETTENGKYYLYAMASNSSLVGIHLSKDNGAAGTWAEIATYSPIFNPPGTQGLYDLAMGVFPNNPGKALAAGLDVYEWTIDPNSNPAFGQWAQRSFWAAAENSPIYVHADQHDFVWNSAGDLYILSDGGVTRSPNTNITDVFFPSNRGFNVSQFYNMGFSAHGEVMGGLQDNGTQYNDLQGNTSLEFVEVLGGDGFTCDISHLDPNFLIGSLYFGGISRSNDAGFSWGTFWSGTLASCGNFGAITGGVGAFRTVGRLWETDNDLGSTDSIVFLADSSMAIGDTAWVQSSALQLPLFQVLTQPITVVDTIFPSGTTLVGGNTFNFFLNPNDNMDTILVAADPFMLNVPLDTIRIQDVIQSWYGMGISSGGTCGGVWITRDAIKLSNDPFWWQIDAIQNPVAIEFSADGDIMYVGTSGGALWRVDNLSSLYANEFDPGFSTNDPGEISSLNITQIYQGNSSVTGIAIDPNDAGHVVITHGGFNNSNVFRTMSADTDGSSTGNGSFTTIDGNLINTPVYSAIIDRDYANTGLIVLGTEFGVYATDNGSTWDFVSGADPSGMGIVPVYEVRQQWRGFDEGAYRPGEIYLATFGRGIWASTSFLDIPGEIDGPAKEESFIVTLNVYPNPMNEAAKIEFELLERSSVVIEVYSLTGRKVKEINAGNMGSGQHVIDLSSNDLASGNYLVNVIAGNSRKTAKIVVSK